MIHVTVYQNQEGKYTAFCCIGHAKYAEAGQDIVCAAVSALVINTINSIEQLTGDTFLLDTDQESGHIGFSLEENHRQESVLLIHSLVLGLQGIQNFYGNEYLSLNFKEV